MNKAKQMRIREFERNWRERERERERREEKRESSTAQQCT
jgi:hypothetical protein